MSSTKFKKDKEIIGDYETQVKGAPPKCVLCVRVRACACRVDVCIVCPPPVSSATLAGRPAFHAVWRGRGRSNGLRSTRARRVFRGSGGPASVPCCWVK